LRAENAELKKALENCGAAPPKQPSQPPRKSPSPHPPSIVHSDDACDEKERRRCAVLIGLPESGADLPSVRVADDFRAVRSLLDFLGIQCYIVHVDRMGPYNRSHPRLLKICLPRSFYVNQLLRRAHRLRYYSTPKLFLRPSLSKEERTRARAERLSRRTPRSQSVAAPVEPITPQRSSVAVANVSRQNSALKPTNV
uniref:Transposase n=1 Tax=Nippostrongylus brasiliensis TaxID=27835 RepID=A0A0N4YY39_NIPBR